MSSTLYQSLEKLANSIRTKKGISKKMTIQQMTDELTELHTREQLYAKTMTGTLTVPSGTTNLGYACFAQFFYITKIVLPNTLTTIANACFWGCSRATEVIIPTSVTSIGSSAFRLCGLTSITIPSSVTSIGSNCFTGSKNLATVHVEKITPPTAGTTIFADCSPNLKIYVPSSAVSAYQSATNWSDYATQIYGY